MTIFNLLIFYYYLLLAYQIVAILFSCKKIRANTKYASEADLNLNIIIPVFQEQNIIRGSFLHFSKISEATGANILYVTTKRENQGKGETTRHILEQLITETPKVRVIEAKNQHGWMASQINYGVSYLNKHMCKGTIGVFNVDSRPSAEGVIDATILSESNPSSFVQQYSFYAQPVPQTFSGSILYHAMMWQNRWTLQFELGRQLLFRSIGQRVNRVLKEVGITRSLFSGANFHYLIGHGIFFPLEFSHEAHIFSERFKNEDAYLSLETYAINREILPSLYLEKSLFAQRLDIYVRQQSVWFLGPFLSFFYIPSILKSGLRASKLRIITGSIQLFFHAIFWIGSPIVYLFVIPILLTVYTSNVYLLIWSIFLISHITGINILAALVLKKLGYNMDIRLSIFGSVIFFVLHCVGPIWALIRYIFRWGGNEKYATEKF